MKTFQSGTRAVCTMLMLGAIAASCGSPPKKADPHLSFDMRPKEVTLDLPLSTSQIAAKSGPSVVVVLGTDKQGSGVVIHEKKGLVVTNAHVVEKDSTVKVLLKSGKERRAEVVISNPDQDLAILAIEDCECPAAGFGDDTALRAGDAVVAIGAPLGLEQTVSSGNISAVRMADGLRILQITVPISPGSSGGGLFDDHGRLVGVTTATATQGQNINFALPVSAVRAMMEMGAKKVK